MKVWLIETRDSLPSEAYDVVAVCSDRDKAIQWIKDFGEENADNLKDFYAIFPAEVDGGTDSVAMDVTPEYFSIKGNAIEGIMS